MFAAFLAAIFLALSAVSAHRTTRLVGASAANFARLGIATGILGFWAHTFGSGWRGAGLWVFVLSGVVGFGMGDMAMFVALPRLGSRLTALMVQCLASPFAALIECLWLGTRPSGLELLCGAMILLGVGLAMAPGLPRMTAHAPAHVVPHPVERTLGVFFGLIAALGQAGGAVISRKAFALNHAAGYEIDGVTAAYQRVLGGIVVIGIGFALSRRIVRPPGTSPVPQWKTAWPWIVANGLVGATIGVSCLQWALKTTPSALVLPIVALTPLLVVPLAYFIEHERPTPRSLLGGALAVAAAVVLTQLH